MPTAHPHRPMHRVLAATLASSTLLSVGVGCATTGASTTEAAASARPVDATQAVLDAALCGSTEPGARPPAVEGELARPDGARVVLVGCALYAYQGRFRFARVDADGRVTQLRLETPALDALEGLVDREESPLGDLVGVPELDLATGVVTVLSKSRGPGDCGVYATFRVRDDAVVLETARALTCEASDAAAAAGEPARLGPEWPVVYP